MKKDKKLHHHDTDTLNQNILLSIVINSLIVLVEIVGGFLSGSLALLSDSVHNLTDVFALVISYLARIIGKSRPQSRILMDIVELKFSRRYLMLFFCLWSLP